MNPMNFGVTYDVKFLKSRPVQEIVVLIFPISAFSDQISRRPGARDSSHLKSLTP